MNKWVAGTTFLALLAAGCAMPPGVPEVRERGAVPTSLGGPKAWRGMQSAPLAIPENARQADEGAALPVVARRARGVAPAAAAAAGMTETLDGPATSALPAGPRANVPRDVYHEKFVSFVPVGVDQIEVPLGVFQTGAPVEFRVSGSLPYVNDRIESVKTEIDPLTRTVRVTVVARRPAIRLPMLGRYDVRATFIPPTAGYYVLEADGVRKTVVVYGCERQAADAWSARP